MPQPTSRDATENESQVASSTVSNYGGGRDGTTTEDARSEISELSPSDLINTRNESQDASHHAPQPTSRNATENEVENSIASNYRGDGDGTTTEDTMSEISELSPSDLINTRNESQDASHHAPQPTSRNATENEVENSIASSYRGDGDGTTTEDTRSEISELPPSDFINTRNESQDASYYAPPTYFSRCSRKQGLERLHLNERVDDIGVP